MDARFSYSSLLARARELGTITDDIQRVFDHLDTQDFELVLRMLWHAHNVNQALGIKDRRTARAYSDVRRALIEAVRSIHAPYADVEDRLRAGIPFLSRFTTVVSLNYDLLVYWAILQANAETPYRFKDCFIGGEFHHDWERLRANYGPADATTLVFYPHGNMAIAADIAGVECKIHADAFSTLLETIIDRWGGEDLAPVFVSEGTSDQKLSSIQRSPYLSTVYEEVLPHLGESVVVYGWSMSDADDHLVKAICSGATRRFAVSVLPGTSGLAEKCARIEGKLTDRLGPGNFELLFFDATSRGAWVSS